MSLMGCGAWELRSATMEGPLEVTRRKRRSSMETTWSDPSGVQPRPDGKVGSSKTLVATPSGVSRQTIPSCMSEKYSAPSCQRGPSGKHRLSRMVLGVMVRVERLYLKSYRTADGVIINLES